MLNSGESCQILLLPNRMNRPWSCAMGTDGWYIWQNSTNPWGKMDWVIHRFSQVQQIAPLTVWVDQSNHIACIASNLVRECHDWHLSVRQNEASSGSYNAHMMGCTFINHFLQNLHDFLRSSIWEIKHSYYTILIEIIIDFLIRLLGIFKFGQVRLKHNIRRVHKILSKCNQQKYQNEIWNLHIERSACTWSSSTISNHP